MLSKSKVLGSIAIAILYSCKHSQKNDVTDDSTVKHFSSLGALGEIEFDSSVVIELPKEYRSKVFELLDTPFKAKIEERINEQLDYLTGTLLHYGPFLKLPATVFGKPRITNLEIQRQNFEDSAVRVAYHYSDRGVFNKEMLNGKTVTMPIVLPAILDHFYEDTLTPDSTSPCLEGVNAALEKFWYYWKADAKDCKIPRFKLVETKATIRPLPMTSATYPWYDEMFSKDPANPKDFLATIVFGGVINGAGPKEVAAQLKSEGFSADPIPSGLRLTKPYAAGKIIVDVLDMGSYTEQFRALAREAMAKSDLYVFAGHSAYGSALNPVTLKIDASVMKKEKPQIFYFAGCRTLRYYSSKYFALKPEKLNIVTTAVPSYEFTFPSTISALISNLTDERRSSWQSIIKAMQDAEDSSMAEYAKGPGKSQFKDASRYKALLSLMGDENNPTK